MHGLVVGDIILSNCTIHRSTFLKLVPSAGAGFFLPELGMSELFEGPVIHDTTEMPFQRLTES
jgi:hypothetical protein